MSFPARTRAPRHAHDTSRHQNTISHGIQAHYWACWQACRRACHQACCRKNVRKPVLRLYFVALLRLLFGPLCLEWTRPVGHFRAELTSSTPRASYNIGVPSFEARARPAALYGGPRLRAVLPSTAEIAPGHPLPHGTAEHRAASHNIAPHHRMLIHGEACRHMPISSGTCQCMLARIGTCPCEPRHACDVPGGVHRAACTERHAPSGVPNGEPHVVPTARVGSSTLLRLPESVNKQTNKQTDMIIFLRDLIFMDAPGDVEASMIRSGNSSCRPACMQSIDHFDARALAAASSRQF